MGECARGGPDKVPTALSIWAVDTYECLDPNYTGMLSGSAVWKFSPKEFDAIKTVHGEVRKWSKDK